MKINQPLFNYNILKRAIDTYGVDAQFNMLQEETMELSLALQKGRRGLTPERMESIEDEFADSLIMHEQFKSIFDMEKIQKRIDFKLNRLNKRIDDGI